MLNIEKKIEILLCRTILSQGPHSPWWHFLWQVCLPHDRSFPHIESHINTWWVLHRSIFDVLPHPQYLVTIATHCGQEPGWQSRVHLCVQLFLDRCLPQISPHECATSLRFHSGIFIFPQKQK